MFGKSKNYFKAAGFRGILGYLFSKYKKNKSLLKVKEPGHLNPFWLRYGTSDISTYKQVFLDKEYNFAYDEPEVVIDAGANIGLAAILFAEKFPDALIIAIEPEIENYKILKKNTEKYGNIKILQAALWNKNEKISLFDEGRQNWGFTTGKNLCEEDKKKKFCHEVDGVTLDRIMQLFKIETIDILKIDIEGAEKEVFECSSTWLDKVNSIIIELHERIRPGCNRSFYNGSNGFDDEWRIGENVYISKTNKLKQL